MTKKSKKRNLEAVQIRQIAGGKDPVRLIEEFIVRQGFDPDVCLREKTTDGVSWMLPLSDGEDLEVQAYGLTRYAETTIYMGINVTSIPLKGQQDLLVAALELADSLVGIKVSVVGHYLVLSGTLGAPGISVEDLEYTFKLIIDQKQWFRNALADELGVANLPEG